MNGNFSNCGKISQTLRIPFCVKFQRSPNITWGQTPHLIYIYPDIYLTACCIKWGCCRRRKKTFQYWIIISLSFFSSYLLRINYRRSYLSLSYFRLCSIRIINCHTGDIPAFVLLLPPRPPPHHCTLTGGRLHLFLMPWLFSRDWTAGESWGRDVCLWWRK